MRHLRICNTDSDIYLGPIIPLDAEAYEASFALDIRSCPDRLPIIGNPRPLTPIIESKTPPADQDQRLSKLHLPPSLTPDVDKGEALSPTSVYSRSTGDDKPFTPFSTPDLTQSAPSSKHAGAYFVFVDGDDVCDSRDLFEETVASPYLLIAALAVLTGEASLEDLKLLDRYRLQLPILREYIECLECEERDAEAESGIDGDWLRSQKVFQEREMGILAQHGGFE